MQKDQLLSLITEYTKRGILTWEDISSAYKNASSDSVPSKEEDSKMGVAEVLYYIGGLIICIGVAILVSQNWDTLSSISKILVTLGSSIAFYVAGLLINREGKAEKLSTALHFISAVILPFGISVTFHTLGYSISTPGWVAFISAILAAFYISSFALFKRMVFLVFSVIFSSFFLYALTAYYLMMGSYYEGDAYYYLITAIGVAYIFLSRYFIKGQYNSISKYLDAFGAFGVLLATFLLGGFNMDKNLFWETIYPAVIFGAFFMSVYLRVRSFLALGSFFLMVYIIKITGEYFYASLGWAFSLVLSGFFLIAVGILTVYLNRRFLSNKTNLA